MQTKLPPSDSFLSSGAFDIDMPSLPSSKMTNERLYPLPHNPLSGSSIPSSSSLPLSQPLTSSSPSLPLRSPVPYSARHALPNFTFPPIASSSRVPQPRSSSGYLSGDSPGNDSVFRNSISPVHSTLSQTATTATIAAAAATATTTALDRSFLGHDGPAQQASSHLIQRLTQQNTLIRDAWEAERIYLEANRRRAEEVYQEERAIMEDLRDGWYKEKAELLGAMQLLRERVQRLEGENSALKAMVSQSMAQVTGVLSPLASQRGDSVDGSSEHSPSALLAADSGADSGAASAAAVALGAAVAPPFSEQALLLHNHSNLLAAGATATSLSLPPGLDGASRRPHFASPPRQALSSASPPAILDPRTQPESSVMHDFLGSSSSEEAETPVAIIDVQEIDPKLEGISLRATAVQKPTFTEETARSPRAASPPAATSVSHHDESVGSLMRKHGSSKAHTMQVLAAGEARRLTMHAGHTPSHSLSLFPTMTTATGASSVVTHSGGTTPTGVASSPPRTAGSPPPESRGEAAMQPIFAAGDDSVDKRYDDDQGSSGDHGDEDPEEFPLLASDEPAALRGPLMVKNIPAQDELFWAAVNKKLEPISQGQDALPTVVQTPVGQVGATWAGVIPVGGDATRDADDKKNNIINNHDDDDDDNGEDGELEAGGVGGRKSVQEHDVPLRLRTTTNFGAPFGMM